MPNRNNVSVTSIVAVWFFPSRKIVKLFLAGLNYIRKYPMCLLELRLEGQILMFKDDYQNETTSSNESLRFLDFFFPLFRLESTGFSEGMNLLIFISHVYFKFFRSTITFP